MSIGRAAATVVAALVAMLAGEWCVWTATSTAQTCVEPNVTTRPFTIPLQFVQQNPNDPCPPGYTKRFAPNGYAYCVEDCPPNNQVVFIGGEWRCYSPCPEGEFTRDADLDHCYKCQEGYTWLPEVGKCCTLTNLGCMNIGHAYGFSYFHVSAPIRILEVTGTVTYYDALEVGHPVNANDEFGLCSRISVAGGSTVIWERVPPQKPAGLASLLSTPPYDLLEGTATIDQMDACTGSQNCGYSLPNGLSVIAGDTQAGETTSFAVSYDPITGTGSVASQSSSDGGVNVYGPAGQKLAVVHGGQNLPLSSTFALRINEVSYDPAENPEDPFEYVELYNAGATTVYLDGMLLTDEGNNGTGEALWLFPGFIGGTSHPIAPGAYVLIVADATGCPFSPDWETVGPAPDIDDPFVPNLILNAGMGPDLALGNTGDGITLSTGLTTFGVIPCAQIIDGVSWETGGTGDVTSLGPITCIDLTPHPGYTNGGSIGIGTLQRCPNATDTDKSASDFYVAPRTPGAVNNCAATDAGDPEPAIVIKAFGLRQNSPNPFNPTTAIEFSIAKPGHAILRVYDAQGRIVRTLLDRDFDGPTQERVVWDGKDEQGVFVHTGVYFYRLEANGLIASRKMVVLR